MFYEKREILTNIVFKEFFIFIQELSSMKESQAHHCLFFQLQYWMLIENGNYETKV